VRLLVGLGNPGPKHQRTRHNVGFRVAEEAARKLGADLVPEPRWNALVAKARDIAVVVPQTFMNLSGEAVGAAARFFKVDQAEVAVIHDEIDLEFGRIQVKKGGGDAGHNGLRSIRQHLGGDTVRVRFGVGRPPPQWEGADWVLAKFSSEEERELKELIPQAADAAIAALLEGPLVAANRHNRRPQKEKEAK
jgi:PTH1 family peptidyl-tRNA hydrolase